MVAARNDDFGGNFLHRIQIFVNTLIELGEKYNLDTELVIVEWNPQENKSRLKDALQWPKNMKSLTIRIIEVPNEIHRKLKNSDKIPFFEYIAKNVGIRRSKGEYVLATNPDLIFNDELISFLASKSLSKEYFYRIDRYDINKLVPIKYSTQEKLKFCKKKIYKVNTLNGSKIVKKRHFVLLKKKTKYFLSIISLFLIVVWNFYNNPWRFHIKTIINDITSVEKLSLRYKQIKNNFLSYVNILVMNIRSFFSSLLNISKVVPTYDELMGIHTIAAGDFTLMAKQYWHKLKGYPEFKSDSFIDSYLCHMATIGGLKQKILEEPLRIYHQNHSRTERTNRPITDFQQYLDDTKKMQEFKKPIIFNSEDWGLGSEQLPEYLL